MLTSLILGLTVLLTASLPGMELALHAITRAQEEQETFAQKTRQLLAKIKSETAPEIGQNQNEK